MPTQPLQSESGVGREDILTLTEAAAYLRAESSALEELAAEGGIPARRIGGEWRFLRSALNDWLRFPCHLPVHGAVKIAEELLQLLEERLQFKRKQEASEPKPGSMQAVLKRFGVFRDDSDMEEQLEAIRKWREAGG